MDGMLVFRRMSPGSESVKHLRLKGSNPLLLVSLLAALQFMAENMVRQLVPLHVEALGATPETTGLVVSAFNFLPLFLAIPGGVIVDTMGYRSMIAGGSVLLAISLAGLGLVPSIGVVTVAQLGSGVGLVLVILATQAYVARIGGPEKLTGNFAYYSFAMSFGFLLGPPVGGWIADIGGYPASFFAAAILVALTVPMVLRLPEPAMAPRPEGPVGVLLRDEMGLAAKETPKLLGRKPVQLALTVSVIALFVLSLRNSFYPLYLERIGFSRANIGLLISIQSLVALICRPFLAKIVGIVGMGGLLMGALTIGALGTLATPFLVSAPALALAAVLTGITTTFTQPISMILMAEGSSNGKAGLAMGLRQTTNQLGLFAGPVLYGLVVARGGIGASFYLAAAVLLTAALATPFMGFPETRVRKKIGTDPPDPPR